MPLKPQQSEDIVQQSFFFSFSARKWPTCVNSSQLKSNWYHLNRSCPCWCVRCSPLSRGLAFGRELVELTFCVDLPSYSNRKPPSLPEGLVRITEVTSRRLGREQRRSRPRAKKKVQLASTQPPPSLIIFPAQTPSACTRSSRTDSRMPVGLPASQVAVPGCSSPVCRRGPPDKSTTTTRRRVG